MLVHAQSPGRAARTGSGLSPAVRIDSKPIGMREDFQPTGILKLSKLLRRELSHPRDSIIDDQQARRNGPFEKLTVRRV